jgi:hypothetical protein
MEQQLISITKKSHREDQKRQSENDYNEFFYGNDSTNISRAVLQTLLRRLLESSPKMSNVTNCLLAHFNLTLN